MAVEQIGLNGHSFYLKDESMGGLVELISMALKA